MRLAAAILCLVAFPGLAHAQPRWAVDPRPAIVMGGYDASGAPVFGLPSGATRRDDGSIVVADGIAPALRFFDAQGRLSRSVGRLGSGPGEYRVISWLGRCGGDSLVTYDLFQRRFSVLDPVGRFARQFPAPGDAAAIACASDGAMASLGGAGMTPGSDGRVRARVSVLAPTGEVRHVIPDIPMYEMASAGGIPLPHPLGPVTTVALTRERLYVGTGAESSVDAYNRATGEKLATLRVPGATRRPTAAHVQASAAEFVRFTTDAAMRRSMEAQLAKLPAREALPPYWALLADPDSFLWVHRSLPGDRTSVFSVLSPDGQVAAVVELPVFLRVFEVGRDYILGAREDEDGEPQVVLLRFRRGSR